MTAENNPNKVKSSEIPGQTLDRLAAVIMEPHARTKRLFIGWSDIGFPMITSDRYSLGEMAIKSHRLTEPAIFPFRSLPDLPVPVEYLGVGKPIDKIARFQQDILQFGATDPSGNHITIFVNELDFLDAIARGVVRWEGINRDTLFKTDVVPAIEMYSLIIPGKIEGSEEDTLFFMLFPQPVENESNKDAFQGFLVKSMQALISLDARQKIELNKKGYQAALYEQYNQEEASGGDAYTMLEFLRIIGFYNNDEQGMQDILLESTAKDFKTQLYILFRELGFITDESTPSLNRKESLEKLDMQQLLELFRLVRLKVRKFFR